MVVFTCTSIGFCPVEKKVRQNPVLNIISTNALAEKKIGKKIFYIRRDLRSKCLWVYDSHLYEASTFNKNSHFYPSKV